MPAQASMFHQEAQLLLSKRPALVHADAINGCPLVNDRDFMDESFDFYLPLSHITLLRRGIPSSYRVHISEGKTRMAGRQSAKCHMMINSVVWAQYINVTDTQTDR